MYVGVRMCHPLEICESDGWREWVVDTPGNNQRSGLMRLRNMIAMGGVSVLPVRPCTGWLGPVVVGATLIGATLSAAAAPGDRDVSFGSDAVAFVQADEPTLAEDLVVDSEGRIVVVGTIENPIGDDFLIARLLPDGSLDTAFGDAGTVSVDFGDGDHQAAGVALDGDGRIVVVGTTVLDPRSRISVTRLEPDGDLDLMFSEDGKMQLTVDAYAFASDVVLQPDEKIVVAGLNGGRDGRGSDFSTDDYFVARLLADGTPDPAFDGDGQVSHEELGPGDERVTAVALQSDGRIVLAGFQIFGDTSMATFLRLNSDGSRDTSVEFRGRASLGLNQTPLDVVVQADGKLLFAGRSAISPFDTDFYLERRNADGTFDVDFGNNGEGEVFTSISNGQDEAVGVMVQPDGKIIAVGSAADETRIVAVRYRTDGTIDESFGAAGIATIGATDRHGTVRGGAGVAASVAVAAGALQSDGKVLVAGSLSDPVTSLVQVVRFEGGGTPPGLCNGEPVTVDLGVGEAPTKGRDVILGTRGADTIDALGGADVVCGGGGRDTIRGGGGADTVLGGKGNDTLLGGRGGDTLLGGRGRDGLDGGRGQDLCDGGPGADTEERCELAP